MSLKRPSWFYSYANMMTRCYNKKSDFYARYGGRGITVCNKWKSNPKQFFADMGDRPLGTTLDRIDNDKGYSKENCRWASGSEQARNRSDSIYVTYQNERMSIHEAAVKSGINVRTLKDRIREQNLQGNALFVPLITDAERTKRAGKARRKIAAVTHPNGDFSLVYDIQDFCRRFKLGNGNFSRVMRGLSEHCKGFTGHYVEVA